MCRFADVKYQTLNMPDTGFYLQMLFLRFWRITWYICLNSNQSPTASAHFFQIRKSAHLMTHLRFRFCLLIAILFLTSLHLPAQDDLSTPDGLMKSFYACLDVKKGKHIDSIRFMNLFWPGAQLDGIVQSRKDSTKLVNFRITPQEYF